MHRCDFVVVGAGIAGASAGWALAAHGKVVVLERESQPGYHSTGRSAAFFTEAYGPPPVRALTTGSKAFFLNPPEGFSEHPILSARGAMFIGRADQEASLERAAEAGRRLVPSIHRISAAEARSLVPVLRADYLSGAVLEPEAMDVDVHALHYGFLRGLRARGGTVVTDAEVQALDYQHGAWALKTPADSFSAPVVVNAAGAWCDKLGVMAGARPVGLVPKRRTVLIFDAPPGVEIGRWPAVIDVDETFYFKPEAGRILGSPADETPMEPCDVFPDDLDVAIAIEKIKAATTLPINHINNRWAGLRSFVRDKCLVAGFDSQVPGLFWLAGQGGYGIQTSPAMGRVCAGLVTGRGLPRDLVELGVTEAALSPARFASAG